MIPPSGKCVPEYWKCDFDNDCGDGSDEADCPSTTCRPGTEFRCSNGQCVNSKWRCDMEKDCQDGSDEANCTTVAAECDTAPGGTQLQCKYELVLLLIIAHAHALALAHALTQGRVAPACPQPGGVTATRTARITVTRRAARRPGTARSGSLPATTVTASSPPGGVTATLTARTGATS